MSLGKGRNNRRVGPNAASYTGEDIRAKLERYDRGPFMDLLANMLKLFPDDKSLATLALRKPELYISSMIAMARISGFTEKQEVHHEHTVNIHKMSDSQLEDHTKQLLANMGFEKEIEGELIKQITLQNDAIRTKKEAETETTSASKTPAP